MEPLSSDDSSDVEMRMMKNQLSEFGLDEENLSKQEMIDLLKALNNSKSTAKDELKLHNMKVDDDKTDCSSSKKSMKRQYLNVRDRRMPWSLLPSTITQAEKARILAVYIKLMSINNYRQARQLPNFAAWPPPIQIVEETTSRVQPLRSTRSGRTVPIYAGFDDDSSDIDFVVATKNKRRKLSASDQNSTDGNYSNKVLSLKRKTAKDENTRPFKEAKIVIDTEKVEFTSDNNARNKKDAISLIED